MLNSNSFYVNITIIKHEFVLFIRLTIDKLDDFLLISIVSF